MDGTFQNHAKFHQNWSNPYPFQRCLPGFDQRLCDSLGGRCRLLPGVKRYGIGSQRRECASLNATSRPDNASQHFGYQKSS